MRFIWTAFAAAGIARARDGRLARRFSALELIIAVALLAIIIAALMPMLNNCSGDAKAGTWRLYETRLRARPDMLAYYDFADRGGVTYNRATPAETVEDYDANAYIGILRNGTQWSTGRWSTRTAALFDGEDDFISIGNFDIQNADEAPVGMTIIVSFRALDFSMWDSTLVSKTSGVDGPVWALGITSVGSSRRLFFTLRTKDGTETVTANAGDLATDVWLHATAVYDGQRLRLYLNSAPVGSAAHTGRIATDPTAGVWIGDRPPTPGTAPFAGLIDEVAIFHAPLRLPDIQEHYRMGHPE